MNKDRYSIQEFIKSSTEYPFWVLDNELCGGEYIAEFKTKKEAEDFIKKLKEIGNILTANEFFELKQVKEFGLFDSNELKPTSITDTVDRTLKALKEAEEFLKTVEDDRMGTLEITKKSIDKLKLKLQS